MYVKNVNAVFLKVAVWSFFKAIILSFCKKMSNIQGEDAYFYFAQDSQYLVHKSQHNG